MPYTATEIVLDGTGHTYLDSDSMFTVCITYDLDILVSHIHNAVMVISTITVS